MPELSEYFSVCDVEPGEVPGGEQSVCDGRRGYEAIVSSWSGLSPHLQMSSSAQTGF